MLEDELRDLVTRAVAEGLRAELEAIRAAVEDSQRSQRSLHDEIRSLRDMLTVERWVSRRTAAESRGVSLDTIDRRIADGSLRAQRIGRSVRVLLTAPATKEQIVELAARARAR